MMECLFPSVFGLGDVHKKSEFVGGVVAASIAAEGVVVAVEAHVDLVHHLMHEGHPAVLADEGVLPVYAGVRASTVGLCGPGGGDEALGDDGGGAFGLGLGFMDGGIVGTLALLEASGY